MSFYLRRRSRSSARVRVEPWCRLKDQSADTLCVPSAASRRRGVAWSGSSREPPERAPRRGTQGTQSNRGPNGARSDRAGRSWSEQRRHRRAPVHQRATFRNHLTSILGKLELSNRFELPLRLRHRLVEPQPAEPAHPRPREAMPGPFGSPSRRLSTHRSDSRRGESCVCGHRAPVARLSSKL